MNRKLIVIALAGLLAAGGLAVEALAGTAGGTTGSATPAITTQTTPATQRGWTCPGWSGAGTATATMGPGSGMHRAMMGGATEASCWDQQGASGHGHMGRHGGMHDGGRCW